MAVKQFSIALDLKRSTSNRDIEVVAGDNSNVIDVTLTDDGTPIDLTGCFVLAVFSKSDGRTAAQDNDGGGITIDEEMQNRLSIALYTASFAPGLVECEIQIYTGESRKRLVTTAKFNFMCRVAIANEGTIEKTSEWPVLSRMIGRVELAEEELHSLNEETANASAAANTAAAWANAAAQDAEDTDAAAEIAELSRAAAENLRITAENARIVSESARISAENARIPAEAARLSAEEHRASAESMRITAETARTAAEAARTAAEGARSVWEEYSGVNAYQPGNKVFYAGSSYLNIAACSGILPINKAHWLIVAQKGVDGTGAGDMLKSVYDASDTGTVDDAKKLGGKLPEEFAQVTHAGRHFIGGADAITPESIGAANSAALALKCDAPLRYFDVALPAGAWAANSAYTDYPFQADIELAGVSAGMIPDVVLPLHIATSAEVAPIALCGAGYVRLYASLAQEDFTVSNITIWRAV